MEIRSFATVYLLSEGLISPVSAMGQASRVRSATDEVLASLGYEQKNRGMSDGLI